MWWEPQDQQQADARTLVDRLLVTYRQMLSELLVGEPVVWGVGSARGVTGQWLPLVLVSHEVLSQAYPGTPVGLQMNVQDFAERFPGAAPILTALGEWQIDPRFLVRVATRPEAAAGRASSGATVREVVAAQAGGQRRSATVGLPCRVGNSAALNGFITAGHLVSKVGQTVEFEGTDDHGRYAWLTGTVRYWSDPAACPPTGDWDYAVVVLDDGAVMDPFAHAGCQPAPVQPFVPFNVSLNGAVSPNRFGMIDGALNQHGDASRQWLNCWSLGPSYLLDLGDSGTVALAAGPAAPTVFGHFVGGQRWPGGGLVHLYVQDLFSCLTARLDQFVTI